jgi:hypothetical protein
MVDIIGKMAGKVWKALSEGEKTLTQLQKNTGLTVKEVGMGLGWLAKEGKVAVSGDKGALYLKFKLSE